MLAHGTNELVNPQWVPDRHRVTSIAHRCDVNDDCFWHSGGSSTLSRAMDSLVAAYMDNTPLIVTAGQQTREMILYSVDPRRTHLAPGELALACQDHADAGGVSTAQVMAGARCIR
jgi:hypothetical protein